MSAGRLASDVSAAAAAAGRERAGEDQEPFTTVAAPAGSSTAGPTLFAQAHRTTILLRSVDRSADLSRPALRADASIAGSADPNHHEVACRIHKGCCRAVVGLWESSNQPQGKADSQVAQPTSA